MKMMAVMTRLTSMSTRDGAYKWRHSLSVFSRNSAVTNNL